MSYNAKLLTFFNSMEKPLNSISLLSVYQIVMNFELYEFFITQYNLKHLGEKKDHI